MDQQQSLGSAIYLNNIDDFNDGRSQSCINPIFTSKDIRGTTSSDNTDELPVPSSDIHKSTFNTIRPIVPQRKGVRSRRSRPLTDSGTSTTLITTTASIKNSGSSSKLSDVVTATIADCLACSGCITTAETVLLQEQHSLDKLKEHLFSSFPSNSLAITGDERCTTPNHKLTVLTISPASIADLCRYLLYPELQDSQQEYTTTTQSSTKQKEQLLLQLTTVLYQYLNVNAVMDGTVTLHTTLQIAAEEFCQTFHTNINSDQQRKEISVPKDEIYEQQLLPSVALSSQLTQYWIPPSVNGDNTTITKSNSTTAVEVVDRSKCTKRVHQSLPILSSSCPAIVCLVEKSYPTMVSHLSTTVSPMIAAARQFWNPIVPIFIKNEPMIQNNVDDKRATTTTTNNRVEFYHLAVMPCMIRN